MMKQETTENDLEDEKARHNNYTFLIQKSRFPLELDIFPATGNMC